MKKKDLFIALVVTTLFAACTREENNFNTGIFAPTDNGRTERMFNDMLNIVEDAASDQPELRAAGSGCIDTIIVDTNSVPWVMTIDFGPNNCMGVDGRERRGRIIATFTGRYREIGTIYTITPQNYYVDDWKIVGHKTVQNQGLNADGNLWFSIEVEDVAVIHPNGDYTLTWESSRTREWIEGESTLTPWDDVYLIDGTANGVDRTGNAYEVEVTNSLRWEFVCPWLVSGSLEVRPQDRPIRFVDYGSGNCDGQITVIIDGETYVLNI